MNLSLTPIAPTGKRQTVAHVNGTSKTMIRPGECRQAQ